jgi:hypothetical protein
MKITKSKEIIFTEQREELAKKISEQIEKFDVEYSRGYSDSSFVFIEKNPKEEKFLFFFTREGAPYEFSISVSNKEDKYYVELPFAEDELTDTDKELITSFEKITGKEVEIKIGDFDKEE